MNRLTQKEISNHEKECSKGEHGRVAPPRRKKKLNTSNNCLSSLNTTSVMEQSYLPYIPYAYGYPYNCGFAIPVIPLSFGICPPDSTHFHGDDIPRTDWLIEEDSQKNINLFKGPSNVHEGCSLRKLNRCQRAMRQNEHLFRNESLPNMHSMVENSLAIRPQSVNTLSHPEKGNICAEELLHAFRTLEENVNNFKIFLSQTTSEDNCTIKNIPTPSDYKSISSICSSPCEIFASNKQNEKLTLSQHMEDVSKQSKQNSLDLSIPLNRVAYELTWVLKSQISKENYLSGSSNNSKFNENRNKVVITLCFGKGFDQDDWLLFQELVRHPFSIKEKMRFLNAEIICTENINAGVAALRNSLLSISKYGETLLNLRSDDYSDSYIDLDQDVNWINIKGCVEILQLFGYGRLGSYQLCYISSSMSIDKVFVAELTLDILILAEEFRLYLDGLHSTPVYVTQLYNRDSTFSKPFEYFSRSSDMPINRREIINTAPKSVSNDKIENNFSTLSNTVSIDKEKKEVIGIDVIDYKVQYSELPSVIPKLPLKIRKKDYSINEKNRTEKMQFLKNKVMPTQKEEHIYEEISEIKREVSAPLSNPPPRLPEKRIQLINRSKMLSNVSPKKNAKKRPAPMPPFFNSSTNHATSQKDELPLENKCELRKQEICQQCGKLSLNKVKSFMRKSSVIIKEKPLLTLKSEVTKCKHFTPRKYKRLDRDPVDLSHDYFTISNNNFRSLEKFYENDTNINHTLSHSASLPILVLSDSFNNGNYSAAKIRSDTSVEIFENSKNLLLNISPKAKIFIENEHRRISNQYIEKQNLKSHLQNNITIIESSISKDGERNLLNFDSSIPFIDSIEDLSSCSQVSIGNNETTSINTIVQSDVKNVNYNISDSLNSHSISAESLEVKEILRKYTSDAMRTNNVIQTADSKCSYWEPVIFNAQNSHKIDNYEQYEDDRYEIPDVPVQERNEIASCPHINNDKLQKEMYRSSTSEMPSRPCRKLKSPPLPPKPKEKSPPPLPPKSLLGSISPRSIKSSLCINRRNASSSSKTGGSLTDLTTNGKSTGLVFVGNKPNSFSTTSVKQKKYWPNMFCSCLPKS